MSEFQWSLDRLLDVSARREHVLECELSRLSREIASLHEALFRRRAEMRSALDDLSDEPLAGRLGRQQLLMDCLLAERDRMAEFKNKINELQVRTSEVGASLQAARTSREGLEKLRQRALDLHVGEMASREQKQLDEMARGNYLRVPPERSGAPKAVRIAL